MIISEQLAGDKDCELEETACSALSKSKTFGILLFIIMHCSILILHLLIYFMYACLTGSGRKYQLYAIHTSKACNILSKHTAFIPIDLDTNEYLPTCIDYINPSKSFGFTGGG